MRLRARSASAIVLASFALGAVASVTACSSDERRGVEAQAPMVTGSLGMALTARGASGALYRLRDAQFDVRRDDFGFFTTLSTENDPTASTLEASLPIGNYFIDIFGNFNLEKVENGESTRVQATLLSPFTQSFSIVANEQTIVGYRFETNGDIVTFGDGRLIVTLDVEERDGQSRRTVMETSRDALAGITLRGTFDAALRNGFAGADVGATDVYHALIDSYNAAPGRDAALVHCDDEVTDGGPSLNGFPLACPRLEGQQFDNLDSWFPLAFVNRLDLAPANGANCGQQRIIFANGSPIGNGRMFIIVEAQIPNPTPECGVAACRPIAEFWSSLATVDDPFERGRMLGAAFLETGTGPFAPFMNARHLGPEGGQVRTNNFNDFVWTLREFQFQSEPAIVPVPHAVRESPNGELWNDLSPLPQGEACRDSFLASLPNLLSDNLSTLGFPVAPECEDAESPNDGFRQDYAFHLGSGSGEFAAQIDAALVGTGLTPTDIANRARFAGSCMGCHIEAGGSFLGRNVFAPFSSDFVQVSEFLTEPCPGDQSTCFAVSEGLRTIFLPHRIDVQRNFLESTPACGVAPPALDGGAPIEPPVERPAVELPVLEAGRALGPNRTLGGQPVVEHAH